MNNAGQVWANHTPVGALANYVWNDLENDLENAWNATPDLRFQSPVRFQHGQQSAYAILSGCEQDAEEVLQFLKQKAGWMTLLPKGLEEAEELVELLKKKGEE